MKDMYNSLPNGPHIHSDTHKVNLKQAEASVSLTLAYVLKLCR